MTQCEPAPVTLVRNAASYALTAVDQVTPALLSRPTPCERWNLHMLLDHATESVAALHEGLDGGPIALYAAQHGDRTTDPAHEFRARVEGLVEAWTSPEHSTCACEIAGEPLSMTVLAGAAALELAVHGWDIGQATGNAPPIPADVALALLAIAELLVPDRNRDPLFAAPVRIDGAADPSERLLAYLGRAA